MESNEEFMLRVKDAVSLPAQTCRAMAPESQKDIAMYNIERDEGVGHSLSHVQNNDVLCEENVGGKE